MGTYTEALRGLNAAQKKAVTTIEGPVLVIAGPGTGKTQLLTTRIAHILATTDTLPQNILCLTFTDSAAQTMRERLATMIGQDAYNVTISTYHAFGSELIRRFPEYFTSDSTLQAADDLSIDRMLRQSIQALPHDSPLRYAELYLPDIRTLISDAKRALLTPDDLRQVAKTNLAYIEHASPIVATRLQSLVRITKKATPLFAALADKLEETIPHQKAPSGVQPLSNILLDELRDALKVVEESGKQTPLVKWKNAWLAKDNSGQFVVDGTQANRKLLAVADVYEHYLATLAEQGLFDYDDMILRAVRALEAHNDLRYSLQEQYLYLLLDEFQDTNGAQLRLVELLTDNPIHEGRPNVLAVGDDDQAIYAFQGADYSHMLQFQQLYRDVATIPLTQNYRSHASILHTARGVAEQIEERLHHHFPEIEKTLIAAGTNLPKTAIVERREAQSDIMQYAWVTKRIAALIASGVPAHEIAVLTPQHKYLEPLVAFLQQENIPIHYDKRENILDDPAVNQLLRMSELCLALLRGEQETANALWAEVLSFDFWGLPTTLIWRLSWQTADDKHSWTEELLADPELKPVALFFIRLSQLAATETLETMLDYLIGSVPLELHEPGYHTYQSPYNAHYFGGLMQATVTLFETDKHAHFWQLLNSLIILRARLQDYRTESDDPLTLADLIAFVAAHRAADIKILNTSPYATGTDAVQLMTAYKAKGMEFEAVFVLAVTDAAWGSSARAGSARLSLPPNLHFIRYAGATDDERLRLFYVALTRAKSQLYLTSYTHQYTGKQLPRLRYLNETTNDQSVLYSPLLPEGTQAIKSAENGVPQPTAELATYWQHRHESALSSDDMQALLHNRLTQYQLSPTHLCNFIDLVHCGPQAFFTHTILRFPQAMRPEVHFGNAIHETLEWLHHTAKKAGKVPSSDTVEQAFVRNLCNKRLTAVDTQRYLLRGTAALQAYLQQRAHTISPTNIVEYSFRGEGVFIGKAHLAGKIDKLIVDKTRKTITIVDYKTGKSYQRWASELKLHKYKMQLYSYKLLVEGSQRFAGYTVEDAYLEFVEPDEEGAIHELHVTFAESEIQHLRRLIEAMWNCVHALQLPDTTAYSQSLSGVLAFEQDLTA